MKQTKLAIMLQPSSTITISAMNATIAVMSSEGWILQFLQRKVSESCWSIFQSLSSFINFWGSFLTLSSRGSDIQIDTYNIMDFSYESYCAYMNTIYFHIYNWPSPYNYSTWYASIPLEGQHLALHPDVYSQVYSHAMQTFSSESVNKKVKLSRNQKRRQKRQELESQLQRETRVLGKLVKSERKDLFRDLQKMKEKQKKKREKKEMKLSHLIEIHKEVFKHHNKKSTSEHPIKRRVNAASNKKRLSQIKKMKQLFSQSKHHIELSSETVLQQNSTAFPQNSTVLQENKIQQGQKQVKQEQWESDEEENTRKQMPSKQQLQPKSQQPAKTQLICQKIAYKNIGKLTGTTHKNTCIRQWVTNCPSEQLDDLVLNLVNRLAYKQAIRKVQKQDKAKKIIVSGLKECKRTLTTIIQKKKARLLVIAFNVERNPYKGGVDDQVQTSIAIAQNSKIPVIYASTRANLGRSFTGKWGPRVTMVSIINYEGYQDTFEQVMIEWRKACQAYDQLP